MFPRFHPWVRLRLVCSGARREAEPRGDNLPLGFVRQEEKIEVREGEEVKDSGREVRSERGMESKKHI